MTNDTNNRTEYEAAVCRLVERARWMCSSDWNPTPLRKEINKISNQIQELADLLDRFAAAQFKIEEHHDAQARQDDPDSWRSYAAIKMDLHLLAESAHDAAKQLPNSRGGLKFAARGFLHLRYHYGFSRPALSNTSADVEEFGKIWARICESDRVPLSPERLRGALSEALQEFDPYLWPSGVEDLI